MRENYEVLVIFKIAHVATVRNAVRMDWPVSSQRSVGFYIGHHFSYAM